jgi:sugar O-acyltransferase (sialic acid O-acetyltransferase NeuD family)
MLGNRTEAKLVLIGAGGHAREVVDLVESLRAAEGPRYEVIGHLVEPEFGAPGSLAGSRPILGDIAWIESAPTGTLVFCAVGAPLLRKRLVERAQRAGARFCTLVHPSARLSPSVFLGEGVLVAASATVTSGVHLEDHVVVNVGCTISHGCRLDSFATLGPGVHVAGDVHLGSGCQIGIGAAVIERRSIGEWSVVGAGAAIINDVPARTTVVGVPGRILTRRDA